MSTHFVMWNLMRSFGRKSYAFKRTLCSGKPTIFALSSGAGKCGVAVVRVSGPQAKFALQALGGSKSPTQPRQAVLRTLRDPTTHDILDRAIVLWFPGPKSFTGEDTCEFQVHGGLAVVSGVLSALSKIPGLRPAEPGEFSKRAFYNGQVDLTQAEGLADLIHAETEMQRKQALLQMGGSLHALYETWREDILKCLAHVEAYIDFSENDDIEVDVLNEVETALLKLTKSIENHLADGRRGERLRGGVRTVIAGEPNVGKSSLLNSLCQKPAAIVTPIAGTTRDIVEQYINIGGYPLSIADTAGLRGASEAADIVEEEGIARARSIVNSADLVLLVIDSQKLLSWSDRQSGDLIDLVSKYVTTYVSETGLKESLGSQTLIQQRDVRNSTKLKCLVVLNKADLISSSLSHLEDHFTNLVSVSCVTEEGFSTLLNQLQSCLQNLCGNPSSENPVLSQTRHRHHLLKCLENLQNYLQKAAEYTSHNSGEEQINTSLLPFGIDITLCAEELRDALRHLGKITGHVTTEEMLDVIFRDFCIGK